MSVLKLLFLFIMIIISPDVLNLSLANPEIKNSTAREISHDYQCATLDLEICESTEDEISLCSRKKFSYTELSWNNGEKFPSKIFHNVSHVFNVSSKKMCHLTLCDDDYRMGYCVQFPPGVRAVTEKFKDILQPGTLGAHCRCGDESVNGSIPYSDEEFDKNYFGVVYSPYDKYWEPKGPNGTFIRQPWNNYSLDEITVALKQISQNFTYIATFGMGTASNTSEWNEGDKIGFIPYLSAKINRDLNYLALRVAVGIFRKDDINLVWKSKELYNAIDAARIANQIFNGTVWGIIVTSDFVTDSTTASTALDMIREVKSINERDKLHLKVGIRLTTCQEYIANKRPEDDLVPAYLQDNPYLTAPKAFLLPLTGFQHSLYEIANASDFILCNMVLPSNLAHLSVKSATDAMQNRFILLRNTLQKINPNLRLIIETGVPSEGFGNGYENTLENLRDYWFSMAKFAKKEHIMFHMLEAVDQPWKIVPDGSRSRIGDINGVNGTDGHYGWWKRYNNSEPPVYIEKIKEIDPSARRAPSKPGQNESDSIFKVVILCFVGFALIAIGVMTYLWRKLYTAKRHVISQAYVNQFHSGGDDGTCDDNYAVALKVPYNRKYELEKETFHIEKGVVLGHGQYGVVHPGTIQNHLGSNSVAFKCTTSRSTVVGIKAIMSEIKILSYLGKHENLVCIMGAYTKKIQRGIIYMALEFCPLGSVEDFLRKADFKEIQTSNTKNRMYENLHNRESNLLKYVTLGGGSDEETCNGGVTNLGYVSSLSFDDDEPTLGKNYMSTTDLELAMKPRPKKESVNILTLLMWCEQIASAMEYVSTMSVVHADLSAKNVLLVSINQVKVSDFGLSKKMYQEWGVTHDKDTPLPWRWMAPESLKHLAFSSHSDVWSYGVTLWELFSMGEVPYHGLSYDMEFVNRLMDGERLPIAKHASFKIHEEMEKCWELSPSSRPSFKELQQFFHDLVKEYSFTNT